MQSLLTDYTAFYQQRHKGHKLEWDHALGTATLNAKFKDGSKELSVSLYQAVVLLLFNDATELSYVDISEVLRMGQWAIFSLFQFWGYGAGADTCHLSDAKELRRTLQSLACGMKKVLKKRPDGKDVGDDDIFYFNADFTDPRKRVHINSIQSKETVRSFSFSTPHTPSRLLFLPYACPLSSSPSSPAGRIEEGARDHRGGPQALPRRRHRADHEGAEGDGVRAAQGGHD